MSLKKIISLLRKEGYTCSVNDAELIGGIKTGWSDELKCDVLKSTFSISKTNDVFVVDYTPANVVQEIKIEKVDDVILFIKKTFPISN